MNSVFYELLQVALGSRTYLSHTPSADEWIELYNIAQSQSLVGICFVGVQKLCSTESENYCGMSEVMYLTWLGMAAKIQQKNEVVNQQCAELQAELLADGYRGYIMKGQSVARIYGDHLSGFRQSGDIDVFVEGGIEKVLACAEKFGGATGVNELEMHVRVFEDTEVEFHYRPFIMRNPWKNRRLQAYFDACAEVNFENRVRLGDKDDRLEICAPTTEFNLVHQLSHIHLHLFTEGVGLRQLMDYYYVLCSVRNTPTQKVSEAQEVIHDLGLDRFASALMWIMGCVFGLLKEQMLWEPNERDGRFLLDEIMVSGNFGKYDENLQARKSKAGYGFWALFIRNLKLSRFDRSDWFWGPVWRMYHFFWKKINGFN